MSFPNRPAFAHPNWQNWISRFPDLPDPNEYGLSWKFTRIDALEGDVIAEAFAFEASLCSSERMALRNWLEGYRDQFLRDQKRPRDGFDINGLVSLAAGLAGIAALSIAPSIAMGLSSISIGTFARKEMKRHSLDKREELAARIDEALAALLRLLR